MLRRPTVLTSLCVACATHAPGGGDPSDSSESDPSGPSSTASSGPDSASAGTSGADASTGGSTGAGDTGTDSTGGDPPAPDCGDMPCPACTEGAVAGPCMCGDEVVSLGLCCSELAFDEAYGSITAGCPAGPWSYVDGSNPIASDDNPGTAEAPWATIQHATAVAVPGDVIIIESAIYTVVPVDSRLEPALNPAMSGTADAPIVFKGRGAPVVTTRPSVSDTLTAAASNSIVLAPGSSSDDGAYEGWFIRLSSGPATDEYRRIAAYDGASRTASFSQPLPQVPNAGDGYDLTVPGPILGTNGRDHIVWDGMHVVERDSYHPDTGPVVLWDSNDGAFIGNEIEGQTTLLQDNHNGLRINSSNRLLVRNNDIHGIQPVDLGENNPQNHAAIMIYLSSDVVFEHNELHDSFTGFFPKGESGPHVFRFNELHDLAKGVRLSYHHQVDVTQNLFYDCDLSLQPAEEIVDIRVYNNVFYDSRAGVGNWFEVSGIGVFNNLFLSVQRPFDFDAAIGDISSDHNVFAEFDAFAAQGVDVGGLAGWQALGYDAASLAGDPGVVDAAAHDFHPVQGSILLDAGIDLADHDGDGNTREAIPVGIYIDGDERVGRVR